MRDGRVYSTDSGRICPECDRPVSSCRCGGQAPPPADGVVRIRREVKGRRGKTVTTASGIPGREPEIQALASDIKRHLGTGGSVKDGVIVLQGDHRKKLVPMLEGRGYRVKLAGG